MNLPPLNLNLDSKATSGTGATVAENSGTSGMFDASNWVVNFGGSQSVSGQTSGQKATTPVTESITRAASSPALWIALGIVAVALVLRR